MEVPQEGNAHAWRQGSSSVAGCSACDGRNRGALYGIPANLARKAHDRHVRRPGDVQTGRRSLPLGIAKGALGRPAAWMGASAVGHAVGLAAGTALVGNETDPGTLAPMGLVSGTVLDAAQGLVLARAGRRVLARPWALAMPALFALGWSVASVTGIGVDDQFKVFGAGGALLFTLLSGLVVARASRGCARRWRDGRRGPCRARRRRCRERSNSAV